MALIEVIKYNGTPDVFAWKYPNEELGTWTQLIVSEAQEAVLFKGGQAFDIFTSGRHTLDTANIPLLNKVVNLPFGGRSPFKAEVWYINKVHSLDIKWGTPSPIQLQDPKYKVFIPVRSFGQFGIQIEDSKKFLIKLVGSLPIFNKDNLLKYFRGLYLTKVKDAISSYLVHKQISILEINAYLEEISDYLKERIIPVLSEYGIKLINFYVNDINVPEDDSAVIKLKQALSKRAEMDIIGYDYVQQRSFDTLEGAATNPSSGQAGVMGGGMGLGMGLSIGEFFGSEFSKMTQSVSTSVSLKNCPNCNAMIEKNKRFCNECGHDTMQQAKAKDQDQVICNKCGAKFSSNAKFCPECGDSYNPCPFCKADIKPGMEVCPQCGKPMPKSCPNCGGSTINNAKFCPECGISLIRKCSNCSSEINGNPKFCPECGNKL